MCKKPVKYSPCFHIFFHKVHENVTKNMYVPCNCCTTFFWRLLWIPKFAWVWCNDRLVKKQWGAETLLARSGSHPKNCTANVDLFKMFLSTPRHPLILRGLGFQSNPPFWGGSEAVVWITPKIGVHPLFGLFDAH